ncbi:MAG: hypothetical protein BroJett038_11060 [Chloroflexota bacterium]|nr:MAG: hypothetical protein BroJett038_11060 [Chloroflexota bacterium]
MMADERHIYREDDEQRRLRALLAEDAETPEETEALLETVRFIRRWDAPSPTPQETARLVEKLLPELPKPERRHPGQWWPLLILRAEARIIRREIWLASALVMALGVLTTLGINSTNAATPLTILAPVVAAVGMALLYDSDMEQVLELADSTAVSARLLLLARLTLVFGFNLALGLGGSVALSLLRADMLLWPLVMSWLAPMAFLSALAFLLSVVTGDAIAGAAFSLAIWGMHVFVRSMPASGDLSWILSLPGLADPAARPFLFAAALLLVMAALWLAGDSERRMGETL